MGKQKHRRGRLHKKNPTGLMSVKDFNEVEDTTEGNKESALQSVYDDLQLCSMEEKLSALQTLETMAWDASMATHIAKDGVAKMIGPLLLDNNSSIRAATAAALRQVADIGGEKAHTDLMKDDIMTPLSALLKQHYSNCLFKNDHKNAVDEKETFIHAVNLLLTLCENNEGAIQFVNNENLVPILTKYLDINTYDVKIIAVTVQFLTTVTEDNPSAIEEVKLSEESLSNILTKMVAEDAKSDPEVLLARIGSIALLSNICNRDHICKSAYFKILIKTFDEVFSIDNKQLLSSLVSILPHERNTVSSSKMKKVEDNNMLLNVQQLALETLANIISDDDEDSGTDFDHFEEMDVDSDEMDVDVTDENLRRSLPVQWIEALNHCKLIDKIWEKTVAVDADSQEILDQTAEGKNVLKEFYTLRCRAYICLNNFLCRFDINTFGDVDNLYSKWLEVWRVVVEDTGLDDTELLDAATNTMRAIIDQLNYMQANVFAQLTEVNLHMILNNEIQTRCSNASVRVNMIRVLGDLALNLTRNLNPHTYAIVKRIAEMILDACMTETHAWVIAEAVDAIMDLFSEDETNQLAADVQLVERLRPVVSIFKGKVAQQRKQLKDKMAVVTTVNSNISRFIKYKEKQVRSLR